MRKRMARRCANQGIVPRPSPRVAPKLRIGRQGTRPEHEADRTAEAVMTKRPAPLGSGQAAGHVAPPDVRAQVDRMRSGGHPLRPAERAFFEGRMGIGLADVRVHTDPAAAASARRLNALAYTVGGRDIGFAEGRYAPQTSGGRRLLAHELAHVVQQRTSPEPIVHRTIGDGHDLRATRFAGNVVLEEVFDNERVLENGSRGTAVRLVQESLVAQGYTLPVFGADSDFGDETERAVRRFQADVGGDVDGKVGPETMGLLDMHDPGGTVVPGAPAGPAPPPAASAVFSEAGDEPFAGYDNSVAPHWLVLPLSGRRHADVAIAPAAARPAFTSANPAVATVATRPGGIVVTGVTAGTTEIRASEGAAVLRRLRVAVKTRRDIAVALHFICDSAAPVRHCTTGTTGDAEDLRSDINETWERQANVRFTAGGSVRRNVPGNLGAAVDWVSPAGGEWPTVTATGLGVAYRVFRVWHYLQDGAATNDAANLGANTLVGDNPCADGLGLAHETGHHLGLDHPAGGIMTPCGGRVNRRVTKAIVDTVNP